MKENQKRKSLVLAAIKFSLLKGLNGWTLKEIAEEANVPLGNVFYYFQTKESIQSLIAPILLDKLQVEVNTIKHLDSFIKVKVAAETLDFIKNLK